MLLALLKPGKCLHLILVFHSLISKLNINQRQKYFTSNHMILLTVSEATKEFYKLPREVTTPVRKFGETFRNVQCLLTLPELLSPCG